MNVYNPQIRSRPNVSTLQSSVLIHNFIDQPLSSQRGGPILYFDTIS